MWRTSFRCLTHKHRFGLLCGSKITIVCVFVWGEPGFGAGGVWESWAASSNLRAATVTPQLFINTRRTGGAACAKVEEDHWPLADSAPRTAFTTVSRFGCGISDAGLRSTVDVGSRESAENLFRDDLVRVSITCMILKRSWGFFFLTCRNWQKKPKSH